MGNLGSIANMLKKIGVQSVITNDLGKIESAEKIILPGVGHFDKAMNNLHELNLVETLNKKVLIEKIPVLGICLGMQLLAEKSEEGILPGLSWIKGEVKKFSFGGNPENLKIPHMGWNLVKQRKECALTKNLTNEPRFYFVHSYYFNCVNTDDILYTSEYGYQFVSAVSHQNIMGVQFHPEKSHKFGMQLLKNYVENY
jgi:glutamine amidotransferase